MENNNQGGYQQQPQGGYQQQTGYQPNRYNQSGEVPNLKWNWGAFMFSFFWGYGNKANLTFLTLIPFFGAIWMFVCGAKGSEWAWKSGSFRTVAEFNKVQETWNKAGFLALIIGIIAGVLSLISALIGVGSIGY